MKNERTQLIQIDHEQFSYSIILFWVASFTSSKSNSTSCFKGNGRLPSDKDIDFTWEERFVSNTFTSYKLSIHSNVTVSNLPKDSSAWLSIDTLLFHYWIKQQNALFSILEKNKWYISWPPPFVYTNYHFSKIKLQFAYSCEETGQSPVEVE